MNNQVYDLIGIGLGPFNLSIAALASTQDPLSTVFLERKEKSAWHPGLLLNDAKMQTSYLKDLVTGVDPTNPYSFLNYLVEQGKFYPFLATSQSVISRLEYSDYLSWAAQKLPNTRFQQEVTDLSYQHGLFTIKTASDSFQSKHLVVGTGTQALVPDCCTEILGENCFHASEIALRKPDLSNKRVAIIGGGQTGADVFQHIFDKTFGQVRSVDWVSRRANIEVLDESCFSDQYFMPDYVANFYHLAQPVKDQEVQRQKLTSDGITNECLQSIYQRLYHDRYVLKNDKWWSIQPNQSLTSVVEQQQGYQLQLAHGLTQQVQTLQADIVILCTGYQRTLAPCLDGLKDMIPLNEAGLPHLQPDFNIHWQGSANNRIYMVNAGIQSHGIAEPQLSLATWRAAKILNHASGEALYPINEQPALIDWGMQQSEDYSMASSSLKKVAFL